MVAFNKDDYQRLDLQILKNGAISLFFDQHILDEACAWFRQQAYQIDIFDASIWQSAYDFYDDIHSKLGLVGPPESGLDALNDNLVELDIPYESGRLLVFQHFERFARKDKQFACVLSQMKMFPDVLYRLLDDCFQWVEYELL